MNPLSVPLQNAAYCACNEFGTGKQRETRCSNG